MVEQTIEHKLIDLPDDLTARPPHFDDIPALVALFNHCDRQYNHGKDLHSEHELEAEWKNPQFDKDEQARVIVQGDTIVGYVESWFMEPYTVANIWTRTHPDITTTKLEHTLVAWGEALYLATALEKANPEHQLATAAWSVSENTAKLERIQSAGYTYKRSFYRMMIELADADIQPATLPEGYTFRNMNSMVESDWRAVGMTIRESFRDHYGFIDRDFEESYKNWRQSMDNEAHFDPAYVWIVEAPNGEVAAVSLNWDRHGADLKTGWIGTLGVLREHRRKGIASALLHKSFEQFKALNYERVGLGVDASSLTGATRVYERAGMFIDNESRVYEKIHREGEDIRRS